MRGWALAEVAAGRAHTWPYLVRHLASHLNDRERPGVIVALLGEFAWLEARLRLAGINALLGDGAVAAPSTWLGRLERALRQGAHVLSHSEGWCGQEQLASQVLAGLADEGEEAERLKGQAIAWLHETGGACPLAASLVAHDALLRTLQVGSEVIALAVLPDGRLASGSWDKTIRFWDPATGSCSAVFEGHQGWVNALAVLPDGRLASGSWDNTIRLWDPATGSCSAVFEGHQGWVMALAVLPDGRLVSGSWDNTIRLWDPAKGSCERVFEGHQGLV
ncbi:MAG: WD40 repeat domain-containing protein, partial [Cyanobacteriota bacterium]|nr:WD40 repeat domain-containing protein [Cyanobacteriota bacterium]